MSEEIFKILLEEFKRNGVKLIEHDFRGDVFISDPADIVHETFERQCTTIPQLLDFSEHDKVFQDRIVELKKDYKTASELLGKYQQENESLKKRIIELENFSCQSEQETESLVEKLKQRIAELERKETEIVSDIDTSNPLACAESLIEHMTHCEKFMIMPERDVQTFSVEELKEIADYLMVYYKHHKDRDAEDTISF